MTRQMIGPLIVRVVGVAILLSLGIWQAQRLAWKRAILVEIEARIEAPAEPLARVPDPVLDKYQSVLETGVTGSPEIHILASRKHLNVEEINDQPSRESPYLEPLGRMFQAVKDHKQIYLEIR